MAELGSLKDRNADRLKKADRLKRAQLVALADPMIGYADDEKIPASILSQDEALPPSATGHEKAETDRQTPPASGNLEESAQARPVARTSDVKSERIQDCATATQAKKAFADSASKALNTITVKLTFQFEAAVFPKVEAVAKIFGVKPEAVLVKASKTVKLENSDLADHGTKPRMGPKFRHSITIPATLAETWIRSQDPLGIKDRPGSLLRAVALNAFDRATANLLRELERKNA